MTRHVEHEVAHHFDSAHQEFETSKLGMWLFLVTEILMFGGMFVAYTVFRGAYPDTWHLCAEILSTPVGAINTVVLLISSFTMVAAVWAAQTNRQWHLKFSLLLTLLCAGVFMTVKLGYEWPHEFEQGIYPGKYMPITPETIAEHFDKHGKDPVESPIQKKFLDQGKDPRRAPLFFALYFTMTGIHGAHVLIGIFLIFWLYLRSARGEFYPGYFTPVEMIGLYWHIVDIIWIFVFPLFYLI